MNKEYYKIFKYSNMDQDRSDSNENVIGKDPEPSIFRFCGKCNFDNFDKVELRMYNWEIIDIRTPKQKEILRNYPGFKEHKETVRYKDKNSEKHVIMHRNYETDIHKLIIYAGKNSENNDAVKAIKSMFELGLRTICYDEEDLPEELAMRIKKIKESKLVNKLSLEKN